jgi:hypothetical protein
VIAEEVEDAGGAVRLVVSEDNQSLSQRGFAEIGFTLRSGSVEPIEEGGDVEQLRAVFEEVLLNDLRT